MQQCETTCILSGIPLRTLGSVEEAKRGEADGVSTEIGPVCAARIGAYREAAREAIESLPPQGKRPRQIKEAIRRILAIR